MKKVKFIFVGIILALLVVFAFQNLAYFQAMHSFGLDLIVAGPYKTPEVSNAVVCVVTFLSGMIVFYLLSLPGRLKRRKEIKTLKNSLNECNNEITALKKEMGPVQAPPPDQIPPEKESAPKKEGEPSPGTAA